MSINIYKKIGMMTFFYLAVMLSASAEVVLVTHSSNDATFDKKSVQRIFLGKAKKFSNGKEAIPINQVEGAAARNAFDSGILGRSSSQISAYWSKLVFTGKGIPPKEVESDADVINLISDNPSCIGYIDSSAVTDAVRVISLN